MRIEKELDKKELLKFYEEILMELQKVLKDIFSEVIALYGVGSKEELYYRAQYERILRIPLETIYQNWLNGNYSLSKLIQTMDCLDDTKKSDIYVVELQLEEILQRVFSEAIFENTEVTICETEKKRELSDIFLQAANLTESVMIREKKKIVEKNNEFNTSISVLLESVIVHQRQFYNTIYEKVKNDGKLEVEAEETMEQLLQGTSDYYSESEKKQDTPGDKSVKKRQLHKRDVSENGKYLYEKFIMDLQKVVEKNGKEESRIGV